MERKVKNELLKTILATHKMILNPIELITNFIRVKKLRASERFSNLSEKELDICLPFFKKTNFEKVQRYLIAIKE